VQYSGRIENRSINRFVKIRIDKIFVFRFLLSNINRRNLDGFAVFSAAGHFDGRRVFATAGKMNFAIVLETKFFPVKNKSEN